MTTTAEYFKPGAKVIDLTACLNGWPDNWGTVVEVDGSMVRVEYPSGVVRWKQGGNLVLAAKEVKP